MRKQIQKDRCSKIMLSKCKSVCRLYDKVQLAAARMLDAEPSVCSFVCNVTIGIDVPAEDKHPLTETYTREFVIQYNDGHTVVREAVFRAHLNRPSLAEKLELSRRYWQGQGVSDWGIIIDKEGENNAGK